MDTEKRKLPRVRNRGPHRNTRDRPNGEDLGGHVLQASGIVKSSVKRATQGILPFSDQGILCAVH